MIEDFITFLIPVEDKLFPIVKSTLNAIEKDQLNKYALAHKPKALTHSCLAWQEDPGTPMGLAITKKFLNTENQICGKFISWLKSTAQSSQILLVSTVFFHRE